MGISTRWYSGNSPEEKQRFRSELKASISVLERLSEILEDDLRRSVNKSSEESNFELPAWSEFQAYKLGEQACLRKLLELINIKE